MDWETLHTAWLADLRVRQYAANTLEILGRWLQRFRTLCETAGVDPSDVTATHVDDFHRQLLWSRGKHALYRPTTVDQGLRAVRGFFRWGVGRQHLLVDPTAHLVLHRAPRSAPQLLTVAEMAQLLAVPNEARPLGLRDRAVLETLYSTGLRRGECWALDLADVDFDTRVLVVRYSKSRRQRLVPMGDQLAVVLLRYLKDSRPRLARSPAQQSFFLSRFGTRFGPESIRQLVLKTSRAAGLPRITTHAIRHIVVTHMLQAGAQVEDLQQLLGHQHLQSLQAYAHVQAQDLRKVHRRTHPKGL